MRSKQHEQLSGKVIRFPASVEKRLNAALDDHRRGDDLAALREMKSLSNEGCSAAHGYVALFYEKGGNGVPQDWEKARSYYEKGVADYGSVEDYLGLARIYYQGLGVSRDFSKAFEYYDLVAKEAKQNGIACLMLGRMYRRGEGVARNPAKAKEFFERAWRQGYVMALTELGLLEQELGHPIKGWLLRLKAGLVAYRIARGDPHDPRLRNS